MKNYSLKLFNTYAEYEDYAKALDETVLYMIMIGDIETTSKPERMPQDDIEYNGEMYYAFGISGREGRTYTKALSETDEYVSIDEAYLYINYCMVDANDYLKSDHNMITDIKVSNQYLMYNVGYLYEVEKRGADDIEYNNEHYYAYLLTGPYNSTQYLYTKTELPVNVGCYQLELTQVFMTEDGSQWEEGGTLLSYEEVLVSLKEMLNIVDIELSYKITENTYVEPHVSLCLEENTVQYNKKVQISYHTDDDYETSTVYDGYGNVIVVLKPDTPRYISIPADRKIALSFCDTIYLDGIEHSFDDEGDFAHDCFIFEIPSGVKTIRFTLRELE